jgi:hypothetical protein
LDVGAVCAERCMRGSQGGVARESPLYPTEQANHSLETLSTEWFGTSMLGAIRWCENEVNTIVVKPRYSCFVFFRIPVTGLSGGRKSHVSCSIRY